MLNIFQKDGKCIFSTIFQYFCQKSKDLRLLVSFILFVSSVVSLAQTQKIHIIHADNTLKNESKYPDAIVAIGHVMVEHEGATLSCKQALIYQKQNMIKAFGDVVMNQGDTLMQTSKYVHYNGNTRKAESWGHVIITNSSMTLKTDTLHFDRVAQVLYYKDHATIQDETNTLESETGYYFLETSKFQANSRVLITNPDHKITSGELDYFTNTEDAFLYGPTTIIDLKNHNTLYCEKGYHNSKTRISHFIKEAKILYKDRLIEGDSLYYDENRKFASASGNITVTDTINHSIIKGQYSEYFQAKDSVFIVGKPTAISLVKKDSTFLHGDTLLVTGKQDFRIMRAFHHVKFFKKDLQGKCDSLYTVEALGLTKMYRNPVLWSEENQITGDSIYFLSNKKTQTLDSLKVFNHAFIVKKDSTDGFSQIKGRNLFGKFENQKLKNIRVSGNSEMINYNRNEKKELLGVSKMSCSDMEFLFEKGELRTIRFLTSPSGKTYPPSKFPDTEAQLQGFIWRQKERPLTQDDIYKHDPGDEAILKDIRKAETAVRKEKSENLQEEKIIHNQIKEKPDEKDK